MICFLKDELWSAVYAAQFLRQDQIDQQFILLNNFIRLTLKQQFTLLNEFHKINLNQQFILLSDFIRSTLIGSLLCSILS